MAAIGRFRLLKLLGTGGMAEVFLAHEVGTGGAERLVVIKRVLSHFAHDRKFIQMFLDEARLATRLSHPNIATVYEVGAHERQYFLSMEFVHGEDLRSLLARPELRLEACQAALIAARVAAALHHAHNLADLQGKPLHVVHRDVSPQNIRLSYEGVVKVLDFGIAKAVSNAETTQAGTVKGKYPYMSPEQAEGVVELDARSDVFSLGIVLHELLTYRRLFYGRSSQEIADAVCSKPISRPSAFDPAIPVELDRIVLHALERDRAARYQSARELQLDLETFLVGHPATDSSLERFMASLYGEAQTLRERLVTVVRSADPTGEEARAALAPRPSQETTNPVAVEAIVASVTNEAVSATTTLTGSSGEVSPPARTHRPWFPAAAAALLLAAGGIVFLIARIPADPPPARSDAMLSSSHLSRPIRASRDGSAPSQRDATVVKIVRSDAGASVADARRATRTGYGTLTLDARPWAQVTVDGRAVGMTPVFKLRLSAGRHRVELQNAERRLRQTLIVEVPAGGSVRKLVQLR